MKLNAIDILELSQSTIPEHISQLVKECNVFVSKTVPSVTQQSQQ